MGAAPSGAWRFGGRGVLTYPRGRGRSGGMADATVLNTVGPSPCGFESRLRHGGGQPRFGTRSPTAGMTSWVLQSSTWPLT
jgi:hypothetical protein